MRISPSNVSPQIVSFLIPREWSMGNPRLFAACGNERREGLELHDLSRDLQVVASKVAGNVDGHDLILAANRPNAMPAPVVDDPNGIRREVQEVPKQVENGADFFPQSPPRLKSSEVVNKVQGVADQHQSDFTGLNCPHNPKSP